MTNHAQTRLQQRGIPKIIVENLLEFGSEIHDHRGSRILYFDHRARRELRSQLGEGMYKRIESRLDAYAVVGREGKIVTVGHRTRRINHS